jgi:L-lysine 2,3-aminomutase
LWPDTPAERWNDWRWQLSHRLASVAELDRCIELSTSERRALASDGLFRVDLTPYLVSTIDPSDPDDPIRRQVVPTEPEVVAAFSRLADAGVPLGAQTVLLAGINDFPHLMLDLMRGAGHFRTPVAKGIEVMEALRGWTSGYAIPTFVIDMPDGGGTVPIAPPYLISASDRRVALRNVQGVVGTYVEPETGASHDRAACDSCRAATASGVTGLLHGRGGTLRPADGHEDGCRP